jgi:hypothetical protein
VDLLERRTLTEITGGTGGPHAAGDLGFARLEHGYPVDVLDAVHARSVQLREASRPKGRGFLGLDHLRCVQHDVAQVAELVHDRTRLEQLSDVAGVELEPYPISTSCSGVNFYWSGQQPIEFHCDGPAFVELVPLYVDGAQEGGITLVFRGPVDVGLSRCTASQGSQTSRCTSRSAWDRASCSRAACLCTRPRRCPTVTV